MIHRFRGGDAEQGRRHAQRGVWRKFRRLLNYCIPDKNQTEEDDSTMLSASVTPRLSNVR